MTTTDAGKAQPGLPPFYKNIALLDSNLHQGLKLDRNRKFGYAAQANAVPLGLSELMVVTRDMPIVFTRGDNPIPIAVLGIRNDQNLFVGPSGEWAPDTYMPAYIRAYPFILIEGPQGQGIYLGYETEAECLKTGEGDALFEGKEPSKTAQEAMAFCVAYKDDLARAGEFGKALDQAGLLEDNEAMLTFRDGTNAKVDGFRVMAPSKFDALEDSVIVEWRKKGWLTAAYAHLFSGPRWGRIVELAAKVRDAK